jgi:hypothetical protein
MQRRARTMRLLLATSPTSTPLRERPPNVARCSQSFVLTQAVRRFFPNGDAFAIRSDEHPADCSTRMNRHLALKVVKSA